MNRKEFIKNCSVACLGTSAIIALLQGCASSAYYAKSEMNDNLVSIRKSEFIQIKNEKQISRKYVVIKNDKYTFPIVIYKISEDTYSALLMECTHKGCELQPQGSFLVCPCHGSEFSNQGVVQNPPAERNLQSFTVTSDDENIYLHI